MSWDVEEDEQPPPPAGAPYRTAQRTKAERGVSTAADVALGDPFTVIAGDGRKTAAAVAEILVDEWWDLGSVVERSWVLRLDDGSVMYLENTWGPNECGRVYPDLAAMADDLWPEWLAEPTLLPLLHRLNLLRLDLRDPAPDHETPLDQVRDGESISPRDTPTEAGDCGMHTLVEACNSCSPQSPSSVAALLRDLRLADLSEDAAVLYALARHGLLGTGALPGKLRDDQPRLAAVPTSRPAAAGRRSDLTAPKETAAVIAPAGVLTASASWSWRGRAVARPGPAAECWTVVADPGPVPKVVVNRLAVLERPRSRGMRPRFLRPRNAQWHNTSWRSRCAPQTHETFADRGHALVYGRAFAVAQLRNIA